MFQRIVFAHCMKGVGTKIDDYLVYLSRIGKDGAAIRVNILFDYIKPDRVKLEHHFNSVVPGGGPHTNYNIDTNNYNDIYHNIVMRDIEIEDKPKINNVVI